MMKRDWQGKMAMIKRMDVEIGDVFHIFTPRGRSYGQVREKDPEHQERHIIAVFQERYPKNPKDYASVVAKEPMFITSFPIDTAVKKGLFALFANVPVPKYRVDVPVVDTTGCGVDDNGPSTPRDDEGEGRYLDELCFRSAACLVNTMGVEIRRREGDEE